MAVVWLDKLTGTAHIHDLPVVGFVYGPGLIVLWVRIDIAHKVYDRLLEKPCKCRINGRDKGSRRVLLFKTVVSVVSRKQDEVSNV